jgi:hypothetical protein
MHREKRILKAVREKKQTTYTGKPIKIAADFSTETLKVRRAWSDVFQALNENNVNSRILYSAKLSLKKWSNKSLHYKRFFKESCKQKMKAKKPMKGLARK